MALTDDEQTELLQKTREIWDQLRGPAGQGWPQLDNLTPVDAIAETRNFYEAKIAELEVLHQSKVNGTFDPGERDTLDQQYRREREHLTTERDHKIDKLRAMAESIEPRLIEAWPRRTRAERRPFDRIRRAYVEARYAKHYRITAEELAAAAASVERLQAIVRAVCETRICGK